jgi:HEPN domain-containing protein
MKSYLDHAWGWITKGDNDLACARLMIQCDGPFDTACFHCQQAVEKYLKAILAYSNRPIPHTHNLKLILQECLQVFPTFGLEESDVAWLTPYAVELRYDLTFAPSRKEAQEAVQAVLGVREKVLLVLPARPSDSAPACSPK